MPKDKEWSAVATLLNEINILRERVDVLESWLWMWRPRTSDVIWYRTPREQIIGINEAIPEWIDTNQPIAETNIPIRNVTVSRDDTIYATTNNNVTIPLTWIGWHYGTAYCASSNN